ncbi:unnamed protein product [Rotaria magnacalcarata]|uniref:Tetratricopeptide repeat protein n=1 Tax=Rotaria magnacalcarata TaxID=392030 RepID=A0A815TBA9_9BILA|nr:unnamed protein product [Rotaria magnacalcarata]CAF4112579.1 unnamed protein product [Rotaria magnacalcarata]
MSIVPFSHIDDRETSTINLNQQQTSFMWYQLLIEILKQMPLTNISRNDLLHECRIEYADDKREIDRIQEFSNTYNSDNVIQCYTKEENEVSFTIGTIFEINIVEELSDTIWHVKLTLCDDDNDLNRIDDDNDLKCEIDHISDISFLVKIFIYINELGKAKDLYNLILTDLPSDHRDRISIKNNIGAIHFGNGQYCDALKYYRQALKISRLLIPKDFITLSTILNNIEHAYN